MERVRVFLNAVAVSLLMVASAGGATGDPRPTRSEKACSLISAAEIEGALGLKSDKPLVGQEIPYKKDATHDHDGSLFTCQGTVGGRYVMVAYGTRPVTPKGRKRTETRIDTSQERLRKEGYAIDAGNFGDVKCWTMAAPPADKSATAMFATNCRGTRGDYFVSVAVSGAGRDDIIPMEKLKALADKALSRLP